MEALKEGELRKGERLKAVEREEAGHVAADGLPLLKVQDQLAQNKDTMEKIMNSSSNVVTFDVSHSARSPYVLVALSELLHHAATAVLMLPVLSSSSAAATFAMHRRPTTAAAAKNA